MSDIMAFIPARAGSKSVVHKNIKLLKNHPLIAYSIRAALLTSGIDRVIVSTDSEEYAEIARNYGAETPFIRPQKLSNDNSTDYDWIYHALTWFRKEEGKVPRLIAHLRPTTPLRDPKVVEMGIRYLGSEPQATALRSVHEMSSTAYKCFQTDSKYLTCAFTSSYNLDEGNAPRQNYPATYEANGYVDVLRSNFILNNPEKIHGNKVLAYIIKHTFDVDSKEDFKYLENEVVSYPELFNRLFQPEKSCK